MNKHLKSQHPLLLETLEHKDMVGQLKPTLHVDEFASKMGDDADIIVLSFFVRDRIAARDLMNWFEKGYDWVLDADVSPGEISPGRYLVYVEMRRRTSAPEKVTSMLEDLESLTEFKPDDWTIHTGDHEGRFSEEEFRRLIPLSPKAYREQHESNLNNIRAAAGLDTVQVYDREEDIRQLQNAAGI